MKLKKKASDIHGMAHFQGDVVLYLFTISSDQRCMIYANLNVKNMLYGTDTNPCTANKNENKYMEV